VGSHGVILETSASQRIHAWKLENQGGLAMIRESHDLVIFMSYQGCCSMIVFHGEDNYVCPFSGMCPVAFAEM
jgi:hypothetical protein